MVIREDLVASAATFLQDPSVASSTVENRIAFLKAKNLTDEEVNAALARSSSSPAPGPAYAARPATAPQQFYGQYPPYPWQPPMAPEIPRRDWRDWFIMATVIGGVGYGLFSLTKRYVYPLILPPTPERLEQDKKAIDEQFERAFGLVEQLAKDTEVLKAAEQERTQRLDNALSELEAVMNDLKSANRRREDEASRVRDDVRGLKDAIPKALDSQKDITETRLKEVNEELKSLKTLIAQRLNPSAASPDGAAASSMGPASRAVATSPNGSAEGAEASRANGRANGERRQQEYHDYVAGYTRNSPFNSGIPQSKAAIPAWQLAMATKANAGSSSPANESASEGSAQEDVPVGAS